MELDELLSIEPPETIYHYTNQEGLLGIIGKKQLWATEINYLNDHSEFNYACQLARETIEELIKNPVSPAVERALILLRDTMNEFPAHIGIYVFSLSTKDDLLSQWRAYSGHNSGYSIGFDSNFLINLAHEGQGHSLLLPCIYDESKQRALMRDIINNAITSYMISLKESLGANRISKVSPEDMFVSDILRYGPIFKDEAFSEEKEWRLIILNMVGFYRSGSRVGKSTIVPYAIFDITPKESGHGINEIIIGPTPHPILAKNALAHFLTENTVYQIGNQNEILLPKIEVSKIPYRNW